MRCQEDIARAIAKVRGPESPVAQALVELERRRSLGDEVILVSFRGKWLVEEPGAAKQNAEEASARSRQVAQERRDARTRRDARAGQAGGIFPRG